MSELLVTQCPHCQTRFRLTPAQLSVASGQVRCGACLEVFQAADAAPVDSAGQTIKPAPPAPQPQPQPHKPTTPSSQDHLLEYDLDEPDLAALGLDESIIHEINPDLIPEPLPAPEQAPATPPATELHEDFLSTPPARDFGPDFDHQRADRDAVLPDEDFYADKGIFQRDQPAPVDEPGAPELESEPESESEPAVEETAPPAEPAASTPEAEADALDLDNEQAPIDYDEVLPDRDERPEPPMTPLRLALLEEQLLGEAPAPRRRRTGLWTTLALLALLALPAQYLFYNFDALARDERHRPLLESICLMAQCELPARVDISRIRSTNLLVRPHPEFPSALAIDVILYNRADFAQPFPVLEMQFSDATGRPVASRRFRPEEYLAGELAGVSLMPSQTPIHVGLSMLDPGQQARSYRLEFLSP